MHICPLAAQHQLEASSGKRGTLREPDTEGLEIVGHPFPDILILSLLLHETNDNNTMQNKPENIFLWEKASNFDLSVKKIKFLTNLNRF
jgi:hypothetical protein